MNYALTMEIDQCTKMSFLEYESYRSKIYDDYNNGLITYDIKSFAIQLLDVKFAKLSSAELDPHLTVGQLLNQMVDSVQHELKDHQLFSDIFCAADPEMLLYTLSILKKTVERLYGTNGERIAEILQDAYAHKSSLNNYSEIIWENTVDGFRQAGIISLPLALKLKK